MGDPVMVDMRTGDYPTDVSFVENYYPFLSPRWMRYIAILNGRLPAMEERYDYAELGCGSGLSLIVHAAANPRASFIGVEFNPDLTARANRLASSCRLNNISFLTADLRDPSLFEQLPDLDCVAMHGLYSWVGQDVRDAVHSLLDRRLLPGGLVSITYNAMPGWAGLAPLGDIMRSYTARLAGDSRERARKGLRYLRWLCDHNSQFFQANPMARMRLEQLESSDLRYVAHEYFAGKSRAYYFHEIDKIFSGHGLTFAGTSVVTDNYSDLTVPRAALEALGSLNGVTGRQEFENHRDFILNCTFRRDVFIRDVVAESSAVAAAMTDMRFCAVVPVSQFKYEMTAPVGTVSLKGRLLERLVPLLAKPVSVRELTGLSALSGFSPENIRTAMHRLVMTTQVVPAGPDDGPAPNANSNLGEYQLRRRSDVVLASIVTGAGVRVTSVDAILLHCRERNGPAGAVQGAVDWMRSNRVQLRVRDELLDADAASAQLESRMAAIHGLVENRLAPLGVWPAANTAGRD